MHISGKEKRAYRARGQMLPVQVTVGKAGVTPAVLAELRQLFERGDLVKVRLLGDAAQRDEWLALLTKQTPCLFAGSVGRSYLLVRAPQATADDSPFTRE